MSKPKDDGDGLQSLKRLSRRVPKQTELGALLRGLDDPGATAAGRDRYIAIIAAGAVEHGLLDAISQHLTADLQPRERDDLFKQVLGSFANRIGVARALGILTAERAAELHLIREVRNAFAHTLEPVSFNASPVLEIVGQLRHYTTRSWDAYFAPVFPVHRQFLIVCTMYYLDLTDHLRPTPDPDAPGGPDLERAPG